MLVQRFISIFFVAIYTVIVFHDLIPHGHKLEDCNIHDHHADDQPTSDNICNFPYHQHNYDESGVFLHKFESNLKFEFYKNLSDTIFDFNRIVIYLSINYFFDDIPILFKNSNLASMTLRGPPIFGKI